MDRAAPIRNEGRETSAVQVGLVRAAHGVLGSEGEWRCGLCGAAGRFSTMLRFYARQCDYCLAQNTFEFLEEK